MKPVSAPTQVLLATVSCSGEMSDASLSSGESDEGPCVEQDPGPWVEAFKKSKALRNVAGPDSQIELQVESKLG